MSEKKKIEPVIDGEVKMSKKKQLKDSFIAKDMKTVAHSTVFDVFIPSIKRVFYDVMTKALGMSLFGDYSAGSSGAPRDYSKPYQTVSFKSYDQAYKPVQQAPKPVYDATCGFDYDHFVFESRGDAEAVLNQMQDCIEEYGLVTVSELYDMVRKTAPYTSENYGWKNISSAKVGLCSEGFTLILPKAQVIDRNH